MPEKFDKCRKAGGKIRTVKGPDKRWKVPAGKYRHICFLPSGKTYKGELKTPQSEDKKNKAKTGKKKKWTRKIDKKMRNYGETDFQKKLIRVNPRKGDTLNTIIHEELHKTYPKKTEKWIKKKAKKVEKEIGPKKMLKLIRKFAKQ